MTFLIPLIGRLNVGKSLLFNRLTRTQDALVADYFGLTRDLKYGDVKWCGYHFIFVDTGGISKKSSCKISSCIVEQSFMVVKEAHLILFIVDFYTGLIDEDRNIVKYLCQFKKYIILVINKVDHVNDSFVIDSFRGLGIAQIVPVSASSGFGIKNLLKQIISVININFSYTKIKSKIIYNKERKEVISNNKELFLRSHLLPIKLAIVGRPNVGKSTLVNCILNKKRMLVCDIPGTTRDCVHTSMIYNGCHYILVDTPGVRKRSKILDKMEKFFIRRTLQVIKNVNVILFILDANDGIVDQDLSLLRFILNQNKSLVIVVNKWDSILVGMREKIKNIINHRINFINFVQIHFISALNNIGIDDVMCSVFDVYQSSFKHIGTAYLNKLMQNAVDIHKPPLVRGKPIQLKYVHMGGRDPLIIVIHGIRVKYLTHHYKRYVINYFIRLLRIKGAAIKIIFNEIDRSSSLGKLH
ncbi:ribosome biogenesis GTPase Der [Blochmannia endosymbiont of Colobopsis nipponica]|uniref:ribosome biogenesis GTPase Der n=1 Tax=Blochmannia endosymbiont of Colobopsis nipponica TaxID=2681987 RepID=UPI00177B0289|nr:ribosome biogenesis GTPase Der [Blochmannia endosymbiont of Colobopsis nipponica]QOI10943.1 ribosome biogenesis GTPase Der [Blochmannia endosymbiont of Colobopsis nipponica]